MIYAKTAMGLAAMHDRSAGLSPRQRSAFIMFDGKRHSSEILKMTAGVGVAQIDIDHLVSLGLLEIFSPATSVQQPAPESLVAAGQADAAVLSINANGMPTMSAQAHYTRAYPIATRLTAALGLRGFRLNLAVEAAGDLEKLKELAPKIKDAVGAEKFKELGEALYF